MKNQFLEKEETHGVDYGDRRRLEMKRRFVILQSRRSQLERELQTIKALLLSLDKQMEHYSAYKQLSINS